MKNKVFVIGFQKTGTTTLETVLIDLGYRVYGGDKQIIKIDSEEDRTTYIKSIMENFDVVQDMPWPIYFKELYNLYPNAKFILTYRDPEDWIRSMVKYFGNTKSVIRKKIYGEDQLEGNEALFLETYNRHNDAVLSFFQDKENFLLMDIKKDFNYKTLYPFLEISPIPNKPFPKSRSNKQALSNFRIYRNIRSLYHNIRRGH
ncbi:sulfotransferase family protein [Winogradskyella helgolandensis]|uniref:sulfotransferase family protein n=1 Tax=Winogradskyella helgolandensis TaxID=2697010 RepID=UPI0015CA69CA|nr:sulfotransferase family protein [Winogradskyella helgolandensis]